VAKLEKRNEQKLKKRKTQIILSRLLNVHMQSGAKELGAL
jgi:hypothetical protein